MTIDYTLTQTNRKTLQLSVTKDLVVVVRAPLSMPQKDIDAFVASHNTWINKHKAKMALQQLSSPVTPLTPQQKEALQAEARALLPERVAHFAAIMGVQPTSIRITSAKTRWGSCSGTNGLSFSYMLMMLPAPLIDYVVVHELSHIRVKNHSPAFYREVATYMPDYKQRVADLKKSQKETPVSSLF